jgi:hypothetical protein
MEGLHCDMERTIVATGNICAKAHAIGIDTLQTLKKYTNWYGRNQAKG